MRFSITSLLAAFGTSILLTSSVAAVQPPAYWSIEDLPKSPPAWYAVEVAKFPSGILAQGVQTGLREGGWGPVQLETAPDGESVVLLGQCSGAAQAWSLLYELESQRIAQGKIVPLKVTANKDKGFSGPVKDAFQVAFPSDPEAQKQLQDELRDELELLASDLDREQEKVIAQMLEKIQAGEFSNPVVARGAVTAAQIFWDRKVAAEPALYLASRVASGNWPVAAIDQDKLFQAQNLTYDLLYGNRRDWLGAWKIATEMERQAGQSGEVKAQNLLRQAALMVDLIQQGSDPKPSLEVVREKLLAACDACPTAGSTLMAQIEYLYLQTFAWQGDWNRVEELATAYIDTYRESAPVYAGLSRVWLAKSQERYERYRKAVEILREEMVNRYPQSDWPRRGFKTFNPHQFAADTLDYFQDLAMSQGIELKLDPGIIKNTAPEQPVETPEPVEPIKETTVPVKQEPEPPVLEGDNVQQEDIQQQTEEEPSVDVED